MNRWNPCSRRDCIRRLWELGFDGPFPGGRHDWMRFQGRRVTLFSDREYSVRQVRIVLRQAARALGRTISVAEWNALD